MNFFGAAFDISVYCCRFSSCNLILTKLFQFLREALAAFEAQIAICLFTLVLLVLHSLTQNVRTDFHCRIDGGTQVISPYKAAFGVYFPTPR